MQASVWAVDADVQTDKASVDQEVQTGEDTEARGAEVVVPVTRNKPFQAARESILAQKGGNACRPRPRRADTTNSKMQAAGGTTLA